MALRPKQSVKEFFLSPRTVENIITDSQRAIDNLNKFNYTLTNSLSKDKAQSPQAVSIIVAAIAEINKTMSELQ